MEKYILLNKITIGASPKRRKLLSKLIKLELDPLVVGECYASNITNIDELLVIHKEIGLKIISEAGDAEKYGYTTLELNFSSDNDIYYFHTNNILMNALKLCNFLYPVDECFEKTQKIFHHDKYVEIKDSIIYPNLDSLIYITKNCEME